MKQSNNALTIEQDRKGKWMRFLPENIFLNNYDDTGVKTNLSGSSLIQQFHQWLPIDHPSRIDFVSPSSGVVDYQAFWTTDTSLKISSVLTIMLY